MAYVYVRLPDDLKKIIVDEAKREGISLNAFAVQLFWKWHNERSK